MDSADQIRLSPEVSARSAHRLAMLPERERAANSCRAPLTIQNIRKFRRQRSDFSVYGNMASRFDFDWDDAKAASNLAKHGVPFPYATRVFLDVDMIDFDASQSGDGEMRRKAVGMIEGRLFTVVYTERDGVTRIISARRCNAREGRLYGPIQMRPE